MLNKLLISSISTLLVSGCASSSLTTTKVNQMSSWKGYSIDTVKSSWGGPDSFAKKQDGSYTYTWIDYQSNEQRLNRCAQTFVTDKNGIIINKLAQGNCKEMLKLKG